MAPTVPPLNIQEERPTYIPPVISDSDRRFAVRQLQKTVAEQGDAILKLKRRIAELQAGTKGEPGRPGKNGRDGKDGVDGRDVPTKTITLIITRDGEEKSRVDVPLDKTTKRVEVPLESVRAK